MPPLNWSDLDVVAVDGFTSENGAAARSPIVRAPDRVIYAVRDVDAPALIPNLPISDETLGAYLKNGAWLATPAWKAKQNHIVLVRGVPFAAACQLAGIRDGLPWHVATNGFELSYVTASVLRAWQDSTGAQLVKFGREQLQRRLQKGPRGPSLEQIEDIFQEARYVCSQGSNKRRELELLLGVVIRERAPARWDTIVDRIAARLYTNKDDLNRDLDDLSNQMEWSDRLESNHEKNLIRSPHQLWEGECQRA